MVEDSEIKTKVSPFAIREGEIKVFDGKDGYVSINQIIQKINVGHISDVHFKIMELVNEFEFITSRQLFCLLDTDKYELKSQDKLNNKLEQLVKTKILTRYYFNSEDGKGIYRVYCMEKMGKYLLNSRGIECKWQPTDNTKPVAMIKKRLAANQTLIAYKNKVQAFAGYQVKTQITAKNMNKAFKTTGPKITLSKQEKSIDLIFEIIRREEEWKKKLEDRMKLYKDFYSNFSSMDSGFRMLPQLILQCEDERNMAECFKIIVMNGLEPEKINLLFTTDLRQNEGKLDQSLVAFKLDKETNKYKIENETIKLLG